MLAIPRITVPAHMLHGGWRRRLIVLPGLIAVLEALAFLLLLGSGRLQVTTPGVLGTHPMPADLFMQSVTQGDGQLGWHQLCPGTQAEVPLDAVRSQGDALRASKAQRGLTLALDYVGARPRPAGGEIRVYVVTGRERGGPTQQRTYVILTQASGCVEDVQNV
jgi:hypothetical protein